MEDADVVIVNITLDEPTDIGKIDLINNVGVDFFTVQFYTSAGEIIEQVRQY